MKNYLLLLLTTITFGQTYQNPTYGTVTTKTNLESTTATKINVQETSGLINWLQPINIPIPIVPTNYTVATPTLGAHLTGIDNKLGTVTATTAGISTRVWFTADGTTVGGNPYYQTQVTKGATAIASQSVSNDDNQKKYYTQDLIGAPFVTATLFPPGTYAGNLSASTTPNSAQQRWTVELYKCDNNGTPIASGVTGAPVGDLGVTVILILDSGLLTLADGSVTNVQVSGTLPAGGLSMAVGQRIRYHVSAEKVGTAASNITQSVYYGTSYNSFLDVPVPLNTSGVQNLSSVAGQTTTEALNNLNAAIPVNYSQLVYVNATNPNAATIFDDVNPPVVNDNALKANVNYLYLGTDSSGWVYNSTTLTYTSKSVTSVVGTGANGQISFWNGGNSQTGDSQLYWDNTNKRLCVGGVPAYGNIEILSPAFGTQTFSMFANDGVQGSRFLLQNIVGSGTHRINFTTAFNSGTPPTMWTFDKGNVAIGATSASTKLDVIGTTGDLFKVASSTSLVELNVSSISDVVQLQSFFYTTTAPRSLALNPSGGNVSIGNLAGTGTRQVVADASGNLSATDAAPTSGSYTPTLTAGVNMSGITFGGLATYIRVGNIVSVTVSVNVSATAINTDTRFDITLPINRSLSTGWEIGSGVIPSSVSSNNSYACRVFGLNTTSVRVSYTPSATGSSSGSVSFQYDITQ